MSSFKNFASLVKFSHTIFALPFALLGFAIGVYHQVLLYGWASIETRFFLGQTTGKISLPVKLLAVLVCMVTARNAAMAFNRYIDRKFDAKNPRTSVREIPAGIIQPRTALTFVVINCVLFMAASYVNNTLCFYLSPIALLVILGYSYTKRFTALCHLILGLGLALAPVGAYVAVIGHFNWVPILLGAAVLFWVSGFDMMYAMQDTEFDASQKLYSIPVLLGNAHTLVLSEFFHLATALLLVAVGMLGDFSYLYWIGMLGFGAMLIYQHKIVSATNLSKINIAFMTANGIASVVFGVLAMVDIFWLKMQY